MKTSEPIRAPRRKHTRLGLLIPVIGLLVGMGIPWARPVDAQMGTILRQFVPGGATGNGRGMAFDGTSLYYTIVGDPNVYKISTLGALLATTPPVNNGGVALGGPLAWDGSHLWTMPYQQNSFTVYRISPADGSIHASCNIATANPGHPAVTGSPRNIGEFPDGLDWTGSTLWVSSEAFGGNWVVEVNTNCQILRAFNPAVKGIWGTSGVAFDGVNLWHAYPLSSPWQLVQTTVTGAETGVAFAVNLQLEDLAYDTVTFAPKCALWSNEAAGANNRITAYEIPCGGIQAKDDAYSTNEDTALSIAAPGVLANDTGGSLTAELVALAEHGSVTLNADGSFTYIPNPNFNGADSFFYVAKKGTTESNIATVTINVAPVNDPPFFNPIPDQFVNPALNANQTVDITGVSPGPVNESGQALTLTAMSSNTALISNPTISGEGSARTLTYQRVSSSSGTATITVTAQDNGGGAYTFSRTFDITLGAAAAVQASLTSFSPNADPTKAPTVTVTITASPIDFNGNGVIDCPADAYRFFPPRPAPSQPYNVIPSNADQVPEAPPWRIPDDTVEVCDTTLSFTAVLDLSEWITAAAGTTDIAYVSIIRDPELSPTGECPSATPTAPAAVCFQRIWTGVKPAGSITFAAADKAGVKNTVTLKTFDTATKESTSTRLAHIPIRVFDIKDPELQAVAAGAIKSATSISFSELSKVLGKIFEADKGRIGTCQTDDSGRCFASQPAPAYDLIIAKFFDQDTGQTVYVGNIKGPTSFVNGIATSNLVIVKVFKNGVFQGYAPGILLHVE